MAMPFEISIKKIDFKIIIILTRLISFQTEFYAFKINMRKFISHSTTKAIHYL
jgi:hypothetical protein